MFNLSTLSLTATPSKVAEQLWSQTLQGLQSEGGQTPTSFWLESIEPSHMRPPDGQHTYWQLVCVSKQTHKINAVINQFAEKVERLFISLCQEPVRWLLLNQEQDNLTPNTSNLESGKSPFKAPFVSNDGQSNQPTNQQAKQAVTQPTNEFPDKAFIVDAEDVSQNVPTSSFTNIENEQTGVHAQLTFKHFVVGKANQMAHAAAQQVAMQPGVSYNPFFLYGGVGLGKTHLIHAIGNVVLANNPQARIRYIHANQFVADVVSTYRRGTYDSFKRYYHSLDVLLIDDIQFFADKKRTQEEFFYAFEALVANRSQIVLTSDTYPKEMADIESRLVSRFNAGLVATIEPPELEMRVAILQEKAKMSGLLLHDDVAFFVAKNLRSNVRELEGALNKLMAHSRFQNTEITLEIAKVALRDIIGNPRSILTIDLIQKVVADFYKLKISDLYGKRRLSNLVLPRQIAMYLAKEMTQRSLPDIGEAFGGRDHTTVLYAVRKIAQEKINNASLNHQIHVLEQTLLG